MEQARSSAAVLISRHAVERWIERVDPTADIDAAIAAIEQHKSAVEAGIRFKARRIKLGCGARLVLSGETIVTVIGKS